MATHPSFGMTGPMKRVLHAIAALFYVVFFFTWFTYRGLDFGPELMWFILGNIAVQGLGLYAEYLISESARQIEGLKRSQYQYTKP